MLDLLLSTVAFGNSSHAIISLRAPWPASLARLSPVAARAVRTEPPNATEVLFSAGSGDWERLRAAGAAIQIVHSDASEYYAQRADADDAMAGRRLQMWRGLQARLGLTQETAPLAGGMGGYFTAAQVTEEMARLGKVYSKWMGPPIKVGTTRQGRDLLVWCVTEGPASCDQLDERPSVLYTALVHAREPATVMCLVQMIRVLLADAAAGRAGADYLLANRRLLLMPVANPDGGPGLNPPPPSPTRTPKAR